LVGAFFQLNSLAEIDGLSIADAYARTIETQQLVKKNSKMRCSSIMHFSELELVVDWPNCLAQKRLRMCNALSRNVCPLQRFVDVALLTDG
jgi:hypothetical protein